jgi:hypothetical protein
MSASAPIDAPVLRTIHRTLGGWPEIDRVSLEPAHEDPRVLQAELTPAMYLDEVRDARLDVRWFRNGDFSVHYLESWQDGSLEECRWDRHENPHSDRLHFHPLPDAGSATDLDCSTDVRDLVPMVVQWAVERAETLAD